MLVLQVSSDFSWKLKGKSFPHSHFVILGKSLSLVGLSFLISKTGDGWHYLKFSFYSEVPWCKTNGWEDMLVKYKAKPRWAPLANFQWHSACWPVDHCRRLGAKTWLLLSKPDYSSPRIAQSIIQRWAGAGAGGGVHGHEVGRWGKPLDLSCYVMADTQVLPYGQRSLWATPKWPFLITDNILISSAVIVLCRCLPHQQSCH